MKSLTFPVMSRSKKPAAPCPPTPAPVVQFGPYFDWFGSTGPNFNWNSELPATHWVRHTYDLDLYVELQVSIQHILCDVGCTQHCACQVQLKHVAEGAFNADNAPTFFRLLCSLYDFLRCDVCYMLVVRPVRFGNGARCERCNTDPEFKWCKAMDRVSACLKKHEDRALGNNFML